MKRWLFATKTRSITTILMGGILALAVLMGYAWGWEIFFNRFFHASGGGFVGFLFLFFGGLLIALGLDIHNEDK